MGDFNSQTLVAIVQDWKRKTVENKEGRKKNG
jgi:hypothetical protein